ncbi:MAG: flagellar hook-basal body complex protein FliE [Candidatus Auribacterota bacterium]
MADLSPIKPIAGPIIPEIPRIGKPVAPGQNEKSFSSVLTNVISDVSKLQNSAEQSVQKLATGEVKDVHQVMIAMGEADVAFKMMMEIRNKLIGAYKEIIKTPV